METQLLLKLPKVLERDLEENYKQVVETIKLLEHVVGDKQRAETEDDKPLLASQNLLVYVLRLKDLCDISPTSV